MMKLLTKYDRLLLRRSLGLGAGLTVVLAATIGATDDNGTTLGTWLGRLACVVALAGGVAAFVTSEQARLRGEVRAHGALGVVPARASLGAAIGGSLIAAIGPLLTSMDIVDVDSLYPRLGPSVGTWSLAGPELWRQVSGTVVVRATGELGLPVGEVLRGAAQAPVSRAATSMALLAYAISVPLWATARAGTPRRLLVALAAALSSVTLFHLVAVARVPAGLLVLPPAALLVDAWMLHRSGTWS